MGLFAAAVFSRGDPLADYTGDELRLDQAHNVSPYVLQITRRKGIDAARTNSGYGRWANDPRGTGHVANAEFVVNRTTGTARLRATKRIEVGEEIFVRYGPDYWQALGPHAKLIARPADDGIDNRDVVDLSPVSEAHFTSDLGKSFEDACRADQEYQRLLSDPDLAAQSSYRVRAERLWYYDRLHVPDSLRLKTQIIRECHDSETAGHLGRDKTVEQVARRFQWDGMRQTIEEYVTTCDKCQRNKPSQRKTLGQLMPIESPPWQGHTWTIDLITLLPPSAAGNDAIVVFVCKLTKLRHFVPCKTAIDAPALARIFMDAVVRLHGMPVSIISDRDPRFTAHFWEAFWAALGTTLTMSTAYHPQTDGQTENANKVLEVMLRHYIDFDQSDWDLHLGAAELAINNARSETTGFTPFYLFYGREPLLPIDLSLTPLLGAKVRDNPTAAAEVAAWRAAFGQAARNTRAAQERQKEYADQHRRPASFKVGDRVWLSTKHIKLIGESKRTSKLAEQWLGPYRIKRVLNQNAYELEVPASLKIHPVINVSRLKEHRDGTQQFPDRPAPPARPDPVAVEDNGAPIFEADRILDHRRSGRLKRIQYLVRWSGYPDAEATWEPLENLDGAVELVIEYNKKKKINVEQITGTVSIIVASA
jgi:hypothetical protein